MPGLHRRRIAVDHEPYPVVAEAAGSARGLVPLTRLKLLGHDGQPPQPFTTDYRRPPALLTIHRCSVLGP